MKHLAWLDKGIKNIIHQFQYDIYRVAVDKTVHCVCRGFTTGQGDPACKKCLGTGSKIRIYQTKGASQESSSSFRSQGNDEKGLATIYYIDSDYHYNEEDIIVDGDKAYIVHRIERKKGTNKDYVYQKCLCITMKTDSKIFLKNFKEIVGE